MSRPYDRDDRDRGYGGRGRGGRGRGRGGRSGMGMDMPVSEQQAPDFVANWEERIDDFDHMDLAPNLLHGVYSYGFKHPSEIQSLAIKPIGLRRSVIAQAQSGTGKTGAFAIGILNNIVLSAPETQALVLAPTRELAEQIYTFFTEIGSRLEGLQVRLFKGGASVEQDRQNASANPHIAVATPGRAIDLINTGHLRTDSLTMLCLDEADQMLAGNFVDQVSEIFRFVRPETQILLFSATIPVPVFNIMKQFMKDPVKILVRAEQLTLEGIRQFYVNVMEEQYKFPTLIDIYGQLSIQKAVIFANSKKTVDELQAAFEDQKFSVSAIHAGLSQSDRDRIMQRFRKGEARVLIATDLLARGIDVQQITLVINYELPKSVEQYLHRIGRSGRYGRKGVAINICTAADMRDISTLTQHYQTNIEELPNDIAKIVDEANDSVE